MEVECENCGTQEAVTLADGMGFVGATPALVFPVNSAVTTGIGAIMTDGSNAKIQARISPEITPVIGLKERRLVRDVETNGTTATATREVSMEHWTDKPNPEFEQWWATKTAAGYQYGREALENVRFGFEGAQSMRWQPIETAPEDAHLVLLYNKEEGARAGYWDAIELDPAGWIATETQGLTCGRINPTHWMPLPDPPSSTEVNNGR